MFPFAIATLKFIVEKCDLWKQWKSAWLERVEIKI